MAKLTLIRGLPGSGKSTYAKTLDCIHYEADQFFELDWGDYVFDPKLIKVAHEWCFAKTIRALRRGHDVAVSNTFTQLWEINRYLEIPRTLSDVEVEIVEMKTQYENIHGVPEDKLVQMAARWEDISQACVEVFGFNVRVIENA
jgi:adenylate kinase family enzyme